MINNFYRDLHVAPHAHPGVIKAAYRALCKTYHPDLNPSAESTAIIQRVNVAHETLGNPESRKAFDEEIQSFDDFEDLDDFEDEKDEDLTEEELRVEVEEYIAEHLDLNDDDRMILSGMTDEQLIEIMESFKQKPHSDIFRKLMWGIEKWLGLFEQFDPDR